MTIVIHCMNDGNRDYIFQKYPRDGLLFLQSGVKAYLSAVNLRFNLSYNASKSKVK
jgi:hypothetical protein